MVFYPNFLVAVQLRATLEVRRDQKLVTARRSTFRPALLYKANFHGSSVRPHGQSVHPDPRRCLDQQAEQL
jgi:hypothetical protein